VEELRRRLIGRATASMEQIEQRVAKAEYEMGFAPRFDRIVINDNLDEAKQQTLDILRKFLSEEQ
jgi:guanylate kinase